MLTKDRRDAHLTRGASTALSVHGETWTRTREAETGVDENTGAPITSTSSASVTLIFEPRTARNTEDFRSDASALILASPGTLQPGDTLEHGTIGKYRVTEDGPLPFEGFERAEVRAA